MRTLKDLKPDPANANKGSHRGRSMVETSLRRHGFGRSVLADRQGRLIAGNKTVDAAAALGNPNVVVVKTTGKDLVVVQRTDLDLDTDAEAKALAIADNRAGELGLVWDVGQLQALEGQGVDMQQFWRTQEWETLLRDGGAAPANPGEEIPEMALQGFEEYNYVVLFFRTSQDWQGAVDFFQLKREAVTLGKVRKIGLGRVLDGAAVLGQLRDAAKKRR